MTHEKKFDYEDIENTPADQLIELPYEQLDSFIAEASRIQKDAKAVADWVKALRSMKAQRTRTARLQDGGVE